MSTLASFLEGPLADAVGHALVHLVWQASVVALVLAGLLAAMRRSTSNARYGVSCAALLLTVALPLATGALAFRSVTPARVAPSLDAGEVALPLHVAAAEPAIAPPASGVRATRSSFASIPLDPALPWVVGFWLAGVTLFSARIIFALASAHRLAGSGIETLPRAWNAMAARLADAMGIDRAVRMLESTRVDVPTVVGWLKPVILVPASALSGLTSQQLETVLAHELAHIRRHDYLVNLAQTVIETLLFYHPAVWWISNRVRVEREHCCDDAAVELCGDAVGYARALATLEEMRASHIPSPALAVTGGSLVERIRRLVGMTADDLGATRPIAALIALVVVSAAIAIPLSARSGRADKASGTTIVVDSSRDAAGADVAGTRLASNDRAFALAGFGGETPEDDPFEDVFAASELAAAELERQHAEIERQLVGIERQRAEIERSIHAALSERDAVEWRIAMALAPTPPAAPLPPAPPDQPAPPTPRAAPIAQVPVPAVPVIAPVAPVAPAPPALPIAPMPLLAPPAPLPRPTATPRPAAAPPALHDNGRPVDPDNPSIDDLIVLHAAGVDAGYVREMQRAGLDRLTARQLATLEATGVDADYVKEMEGAIGRKLSWQELVRLRALDIEESDVEELRASGERVDVDSLTRLHGSGLDRAELDRLRAEIDRGLSLEDAAWLQLHEVDADYITEFTRAGLPRLSAREYGMLASIDVDGDYVRELRAAGIERLDAATLYQLKATGVDAGWVKEIRAAGYKTLTLPELVGLHAAGVDGDYLRDLAAAGFSGLPVEQIMRLHAAGIDADELRDWKKK